MKRRTRVWWWMSGVLLALALAGCTFSLQGRWTGLRISHPRDGARIPIGSEVEVTVRVENHVPTGTGLLFVRGPYNEVSYTLTFVQREDDNYEARVTWQPAHLGEYTLYAQIPVQDQGGETKETPEVQVTVVEVPPLEERGWKAAGTPVSPTPARGATPSATPTRRPTATPTVRVTPSPTPLPCHMAEFVADVNIPDGTQLDPGQNFIKVWRLRNVGSCTWTPDYAVVFDSGDDLNAPAATPIEQRVAPGQTVDVSVPLTAPWEPGTYRANFKLRSPAGEIFGLGERNAPFYVEIRVAPSLPDLVVQSIVFNPATPVEGQVFQVQVTVANQGEGGSGAFSVSWLTNPAARAPYCLWEVNGLAPGAQQTLTCDAGGSHGHLPAGTYDTQAWVDPGNEVAESNEDNNVRSARLQIASGDTTGPSIKASRSSNEIYWPSGCGPNEVTITAYVGDPSGVAWVQVRYRVVNESNTAGQWVTKDMILVGTSQYEAVLTGDDLRASLDPPLHYGQGRVEYSIIAADRAGNTSDQRQPDLTLYYCLR